MSCSTNNHTPYPCGCLETPKTQEKSNRLAKQKCPHSVLFCLLQSSQKLSVHLNNHQKSFKRYHLPAVTVALTTIYLRRKSRPNCHQQSSKLILKRKTMPVNPTTMCHIADRLESQSITKKRKLHRHP